MNQSYQISKMPIRERPPLQTTPKPRPESSALNVTHQPPTPYNFHTSSPNNAVGNNNRRRPRRSRRRNLNPPRRTQGNSPRIRQEHRRSRGRYPMSTKQHQDPTIVGHQGDTHIQGLANRDMQYPQLEGRTDFVYGLCGRWEGARVAV